MSVAAWSSSASAACPGIYANATCPSVQNAHCTSSDYKHVSCTMGNGGGTVAVNAHFVSPTTTSFRAYGNDDQGNLFCCEFSGLYNGCSDNPRQWTQIVIYGSDDVENTLDLNDFTAGQNLQCGLTSVIGGSLDDTIVGSDNASDVDYLAGMDGADLIHGRAGDDDIEGGDGNDRIYGDDGDDIIDGGVGLDQVKGGYGVDLIYGGSDADNICGGPGADVLHGEDGNDLLSGDADTDTNDGGAGDDTCENENMTSCSSTLVSCQW